MAVVTVEVPDALSAEMTQYGISDEYIERMVVQIIAMWFRTGRENLSQELMLRWIETLEEIEDVRDVEETERLLIDNPDAFMTLDEFNATWNDDEATS